MTDELEQRIEKALDLLKPQNQICNCNPDHNWICEPCLIRGVLCDMQRERKTLTQQRKAWKEACMCMYSDLGNANSWKRINALVDRAKSIED